MSATHLMLALVIAIIALGLTVPGYITRQPILTMAGGGFWIVLGIEEYTQSATPVTGVWDIAYALFWLACGMLLVCVLEPVIMRPPKAELAEDVTLTDAERIEDEWEQIQRQMHIPRGRHGYRRHRAARRARSGPQYDPQHD